MSPPTLEQSVRSIIAAFAHCHSQSFVINWQWLVSLSIPTSVGSMICSEFKLSSKGLWPTGQRATATSASQLTPRLSRIWSGPPQTCSGVFMPSDGHAVLLFRASNRIHMQRFRVAAPCPLEQKRVWELYPTSLTRHILSLLRRFVDSLQAEIIAVSTASAESPARLGRAVSTRL